MSFQERPSRQKELSSTERARPSVKRCGASSAHSLVFHEALCYCGGVQTHFMEMFW